MNKPSIPQGTRDFSPEVVKRRQYIMSVLKRLFELSGFQPIETPSMEQLTTLMGKYGDEGDRLIFKILNNGLNDPQKHDKSREALEEVLGGKNSVQLTERALRYDLTIPFARYVVMHQNELQFPFRRYQMQPVWRADRPQKGRYREFWQCDCDIVGTNSLVNEAELLKIYQDAFQQLNIPDVLIRINNRKILSGIAAYCQAEEHLVPITVAIDKWDKIGKDGVRNDLLQIPLTELQADEILELICIKQLDELKNRFSERSIAGGLKGCEELQQVLSYHALLSQKHSVNIELDFTLARGLSYYTGFIVEVICQHPDVKIGSIAGGGRYDDLTSLFGLPNLSGVGISFGIDRIYDIMLQLDLFPKDITISTSIAFINSGAACEELALKLLSSLRDKGVAAEIYPDVAKFDKQMKYWYNRQVPLVAIVEAQDLEKRQVRLKRFSEATQLSYPLSQFVDEVVAMLA